VAAWPPPTPQHSENARGALTDGGGGGSGGGGGGGGGGGDDADGLDALLLPGLAAAADGCGAAEAGHRWLACAAKDGYVAIWHLPPCA
jgi:hypothetical protein